MSKRAMSRREQMQQNPVSKVCEFDIIFGALPAPSPRNTSQ
jgi:hypothetical protein